MLVCFFKTKREEAPPPPQINALYDVQGISVIWIEKGIQNYIFYKKKIKIYNYRKMIDIYIS